MKITLWVGTLASVLVLTNVVRAADSFNGVDDEAVVGTGAFSLNSSATNQPSGSYINTSKNTGNSLISNSFNEINSDNSVAIGQDAHVVSGNQIKTVTASNDMDAVVSDNIVVIGDFGEANATDTINRITGSFRNASGISVVSQNTGHASSIQQGTLIQSNFSLR